MNAFGVPLFGMISFRNFMLRACTWISLIQLLSGLLPGRNHEELFVRANEPVLKIFCAMKVMMLEYCCLWQGNEE